jgi:predicted Zn finger-like uncharacterized protein
MTIREHIKRQLWKATLTLVLPIVMFELIAYHLPNFTLSSLWVWIFMPMPFILLGLVIWSFYQLSAIVCPRCWTWLAFQTASLCIRMPIVRCSHCDVSLDEPIGHIGRR